MADPSPPVDAVGLRIDHPKPDVAACVGRAYKTTGRTDRIDGIVSADRTGLAPRYIADPALPGLIECVQTEGPGLQGSTSFRVSAMDGVVVVTAVPIVQSGTQPELPPFFGVEFSSCLSGQRDLRVPQEGAILVRITIAANGVVSRVDPMAATIQTDGSLRECALEEFAKKPPIAVDGPVVLNFRRHMHLKDL